MCSRRKLTSSRRKLVPVWISLSRPNGTFRRADVSFFVAVERRLETTRRSVHQRSLAVVLGLAFPALLQRSPERSRGGEPLLLLGLLGIQDKEPVDNLVLERLKGASFGSRGRRAVLWRSQPRRSGAVLRVTQVARGRVGTAGLQRPMPGHFRNTRNKFRG